MLLLLLLLQIVYLLLRHHLLQPLAQFIMACTITLSISLMVFLSQLLLSKVVSGLAFFQM